MMMTPPLHILILLPVLLGAVTYFLPRRPYQWVMGIGNLLISAWAVQLFITVRWGEPVTDLLAGWPMGVAIRLTADAISTPLVMLTAIFFTAAYVFASRAHYMDKTFVFVYLMLESAVFGVLLSGDLFNIYVIAELGMICVAILIMYKHDKQSVYDAMVYIMMNFIGMAFMMLGIAYLYRITGVLDLSMIEERLAMLENPRVAAIPYALIMTAVAMKAALWPLFSWLPRAHGAPSAPAIVSAVLSGVQVKVGVYLLIRLGNVFSPVLDAQALFLIIGFITASVGFMLAIAQKDIKLILAYHTVSQVGLIVMGLNMGTEAAYWGGMYHIINHALFKGLLFLTAGVIIDQYGTRSYSEIRGVMRRMPVIGVAALAGILGITGAPFFNGSISKYFISAGAHGHPAELGLYLVNFGTMLSFVKYGQILLGNAPKHVKPARDPFCNTIAILFAVAILAGGLFGGPAVALLYGTEYAVRGAWSVTKLLLFISTLGLAVGVYVYGIRRIDEFLAEIRRQKISFNQITVLISLFFATALLFALL